MIDKLIRLLSIKHTTSGKHDPMLTLTVLAVLICILRFLFDGATFVIFGHVLNLGHVDSMSYGALLSPVLGAHGAKEWKMSSNNPAESLSALAPDDPDAN